MSRRAMKTYRPDGVIPPFEHNRIVAQRKQYRALVQETTEAFRRFFLGRSIASDRALLGLVRLDAGTEARITKTEEHA